MEALALLPVNQNLILPQEQILSSSKPFIEANTIQCSLEEVRDNHLIPTFRNNERLISVAEFIETVYKVIGKQYEGEQILQPNVRLSHPIKGRIPEAKHKHVSELEDWETTLFYERCAFVIEIPSITTTVGDNTLSLMAGGIKSYNLDQVNGKESSSQHFQFFIGFLNKVCSNGVLWNDGYSKLVTVRQLGELHVLIHNLFEQYNASHHLHHLRRLNELEITEKQFAQIVGRARLYPHLPNNVKNGIPSLLLGDAQLNQVVRDYYKDESFCRQANGNINLWKLYNLFTSATKNSYIDSFLERNVNSYHFVENVRWAIENQSHNWFMN